MSRSEALSLARVISEAIRQAGDPTRRVLLRAGGGARVRATTAGRSAPGPGSGWGRYGHLHGVPGDRRIGRQENQVVLRARQGTREGRSCRHAAPQHRAVHTVDYQAYGITRSRDSHDQLLAGHGLQDVVVRAVRGQRALDGR